MIPRKSVIEPVGSFPHFSLGLTAKYNLLASSHSSSSSNNNITSNSRIEDTSRITDVYVDGVLIDCDADYNVAISGEFKTVYYMSSYAVKECDMYCLCATLYKCYLNFYAYDF